MDIIYWNKIYCQSGANILTSNVFKSVPVYMLYVS